MRSGAKRPARVAIVGGGPGGLFTAQRLERFAAQPFEATIFEASERVGGKLRTARFGAIDAPYEAGAAELYDNSPVDEDPLRELVAELGLTTSAMGGGSVWLDGVRLATLEDLRERGGAAAQRAFEAFDRAARGWMSPRQFYDSDMPESFADESAPGQFARWLERVEDPFARRYIENLIHSDLAAEPHQTNLRYGLQNYLMNDPAYMRLYAIEGGNERLVHELAARLRTRVQLGWSLERVSVGGEGRLHLGFRTPEGPLEREFDHVVLALPHDRLAQVQFDGEPLHGALRRHVEHYDHPAHYLRISLLYSCAPWRASCEQSFDMSDRFGGSCLYDESSRRPEAPYGVLGWLLGGAAAQEHAELADDVLVQRALEALPAPFDAAHPHFLEGRVHRWIGSVNALPGGRVPAPLERRHAPCGPKGPSLHIVGDYLFDSTLNGVLESAHYVAQALALRLEAGHSARPDSPSVESPGTELRSSPHPHTP
jgi:monoamine oxidase